MGQHRRNFQSKRFLGSTFVYSVAVTWRQTFCRFIRLVRLKTVSGRLLKMGKSIGEKLPGCHCHCRYTTLLCTSLNYTTIHYTTLHQTKLHYTTLHYTTLHYTTLYYTTLNYTTLNYTTLHYIMLNYTTLHYTTLLCTALDQTTPHQTTLQYSIFSWYQCTVVSASKNVAAVSVEKKQQMEKQDSIRQNKIRTFF